MDTEHRYAVLWKMDGDYVALVVMHEDRWEAVTYWLIPGTQIEED